MHFGRELEEELVPEWRTQYLNYELGKKKIKALHLALRNAHRVTAQAGGRFPQDDAAPYLDHLPFTHYDFTKRRSKVHQDYFSLNAGSNEKRQGLQHSSLDLVRRQSAEVLPHPPSVPKLSLPEDTQKTLRRAPSAPVITLTSAEEVAETQLLPVPSVRPECHRRFGSIVGSPPCEPEFPEQAVTTIDTKGSLMIQEARDGKRLSLPKTEIYVDSSEPSQARKRHKQWNTLFSRRLFRFTGRSNLQQHKDEAPQSYLLRMFSTTSVIPSQQKDPRLQVFRELDTLQDDFFALLDEELDKIEHFHNTKEEEASRRLEIIRHQLHELRDRRILDLRAAKMRKQVREGQVAGAIPSGRQSTMTHSEHKEATQGQDRRYLRPNHYPLRRSSKHVGDLLSTIGSPVVPPHPWTKQYEHLQDYGKQETLNEEVSYKLARRKLKLALQEFYRGLELLKSYILLNQTAFRKINKKYDKAVNARPKGRYMSEKVNQAHFVRSAIIEQHLLTVEDLYARYFKRGDRKIAVGNLRTKIKPSDRSTSSFRNGLFMASGACFGIFGINNAVRHTQSRDLTMSVQSSYLLQLYAAYFLAMLLLLLFTLNCMIWTKSKINYVFIFEFDTRHVLDWRQLAELPCFFLFLNGLSMWLNFRGSTTDGMYRFWPLVLVLVTLLTLCLPAPVFYPNTRKWWSYSNWRLLLAGFYPVEFRDFYLGDMYCSETYAMSQIEVFFCLYIKSGKVPSQCDAQHSRMLGFLTALPAICRAFQCLRRYYDSRKLFPHLANSAKYTTTVLYQVMLSLYRIDEAPKLRALFIVIALFNSFYCCFWDVAIDFSLGNMYAQNPGLRDRLGYRRPWVYYVAITSDVILRQQWILFAIFTHNLQYSATISFFVGLAEVLRRGMWSLIRVENEHCNNVGKFRAYRDIPLPYSIPGESPESDYVRKDPWRADAETKLPSTSNLHPCSAERTREPRDIDIERAESLNTTGGPHPSQRRWKNSGTPMTMGVPPPRLGALQRAASAMSTAHAQDFERKRPQAANFDSVGGGEEGSSDDDESTDFGSMTVVGDGEDRERNDVTTVQRISTRNGDSIFLDLNLGDRFDPHSWRWG